MNKTQRFIDAILIQTAVTKYLKIQINPLNSTALPASSKGGAYQVHIGCMIDNDSHKFIGWIKDDRDEDQVIICDKWTKGRSIGEDRRLPTWILIIDVKSLLLKFIM